MNREFRQQLAQDTLAATKCGFYDTAAGRVSFAEAQQAAQTGSRLYRPQDAADLLREFDRPASLPAAVRVYSSTTLAAAAQLATEFGRGAGFCLSPPSGWGLSGWEPSLGREPGTLIGALSMPDAIC